MAANKVHWWNAPKGYKAIKDILGLCTECEFHSISKLCLCAACIPSHRKDKQPVIFVKRQEKSKTHTIAL